MKKLTGIIGVLMTFIGFITFLTAQMTISEDNYYTWTKPYTPFEARYITMKTIGIILLIIGILDLILYIASHIYTSKTEVDANSIKITSNVCPSCGLQVSKGTKICPKCKTPINSNSNSNAQWR